MCWLIKDSSCKFSTKISLLMLNPRSVWLYPCDKTKTNWHTFHKSLYLVSCPINSPKKVSKRPLCLSKLTNLSLFRIQTDFKTPSNWHLHRSPFIELNRLCLNIISTSLLYFKGHSFGCSTIFLGDKAEQHLTANDCKRSVPVTLRPVPLPLVNLLKRAFSLPLSFLKIVLS